MFLVKHQLKVRRTICQQNIRLLDLH